MSPAFLKCIASVLAREAGFQCDPADPGNWTGGSVGAGNLVGTNLGISAPVLLRSRGRTVTQGDMRALTKEEAMAIYEARYWAPIDGDALPLALAFVTLDAAVNSGIFNGVRWLQGALGVSADGHPGPVTLSAAFACADLAATVRSACQRRLDYLTTLPTWTHFGRGWQNRIDTVRDAALALI